MLASCTLSLLLALVIAFILALAFTLALALAFILALALCILIVHAFNYAYLTKRLVTFNLRVLYIGFSYQRAIVTLCVNVLICSYPF